MKQLLLAISLTLAALTLSFAPGDADAKRLGGGKPAGMQRQAPPANATPHQTPAQNAAPAPANTPAAAPAAATPPKRNWMGPLAGVAAGLGMAALFSHLGMGGAMGGAIGSFLMMALLAVVAFVAVRFVMARMRGSSAGAGPQLAGAGAGGGSGWQPAQPQMPAQMPAQTPAPMLRNALDAAPVAVAPLAAPAAMPAVPTTLPGGMATAEFERLAKMVFIRLQAANDSANLDDLRKFTTPELFASLRLDLQDRGSAKQVTDVVQLDAVVVDTVRENQQDIVTVRYQGLIREEANAPAQPFHELWHLVRPADGSADWAIAGITPV